MKLEGLSGHLKSNKDPSQIMYPPGNKAEFKGTDRLERLEMWEYLRNVSSCAPWKSPEEFLIIPSKPMKLATSLNDKNQYIKQLNQTARYHEFISNRQPQIYDDFWHNQKYIHFISKPSLGLRLLQPFYTFIYFQNN